MSDAMDPEADSPHEAAVLLADCGIVAREDLVRIRVTGSDRIDYLHRMLTQDIAELAEGAATYACLLTVRGRILGDLFVWNRADHLLLEMPRAAQAAVMTPLERYVIADDVVFEEMSPSRSPGERHTVAGPKAEARLRAVGISPPAQSQITAEAGLETLRYDRRGLPQFELLGPLDALDLSRAGIPAVGMRALEIARVQHGIPVFGAELGEDVLFNEAGLEEAVSWTKGCFPGQEPVVMARHRGKPPRRLVQLDCDAAEPGSALLHDGKVVGRVTSAAPQVDPWPAAALGYVRHALAECGATFEMETGGAAVVRAVSGEVVSSEGAPDGPRGGGIAR